jgi:hypothetical protein
MVTVAAIAFFFVTASPANAQDSVDHNNEQEHEHDHDSYSASVHGDCEGGFAVTIKNDTKHDVDALIRLNGVDTVVEVKKDSSLTVQPLDLFEDTPNTILVKVGDKILLQKTFSVNCEPDHEPEASLSASITSDCDNSSVTIKNEGDADGTATVTVNGSSVNVDVAAGKTVTMKVVLTEDADNTIAVTAGDTDLVHKTVHVNCKEEVAPPDDHACPTDHHRPRGDGHAGTPGRGAGRDRARQTLAFTGRNTIFEAMVGVLLLGIGLQLMRSGRRLEQNS